MRVDEVMDALANSLAGIHGLRVHAWPADSVTPPAAIVFYPEEITFDAAYGRGGDRMTITLLVLLSRADQRAARDALAAYMDGSGPRSVKAAVEAFQTDAYDSARVVSATPDAFTLGAVDLIGASFSIDVIGKGAV